MNQPLSTGLSGGSLRCRPLTVNSPGTGTLHTCKSEEHGSPEPATDKDAVTSQAQHSATEPQSFGSSIPPATSASSDPGQYKYPTSQYIHVMHTSDRNLLGSCVLTLLLFLLSLILLGPVVGLLAPLLVLSRIFRWLLDRFCCCRYRYLNAMQRRWLNKGQAPYLILLGLEGETPLELERLQELLRHRVVEAENFYGQRVYPYFSHKITPTTSGYVWQKDEAFRVENHVTPVLQTTASVQSVIGSLVSQNFVTWEHPLWNVHVLWKERHPKQQTPVSTNVPSSVLRPSLHLTLPNSQAKPVQREPPTGSGSTESGNTKSVSETWLIVRIHPVMGDGVSLVHLFCTALGDSNAQLRLKERFGASSQCVNFIRSLFIGPIIFLQKWLFTRRDYNLMHPSEQYYKVHGLMAGVVGDNNSTNNHSHSQVKEFSETVRTTTVRDSLYGVNPRAGVRVFRWKKFDLAQVSRLKQVTRSTFNDLFLSLVAGALRSYQQMRGIDHPFDLLTLVPIDTTEEFQMDLKLRNNFTLVDVCLPVNTEGMLPRLWEVKQRMDEFKNSADCTILKGLFELSQSLMPLSWAYRLMNFYYDKSTCITTSLQGPEVFLYLDRRPMKTVAFWFPPLSQVDLTITFFTYADHVCVGISADELLVPQVDILLVAMHYQLDLLSQLLENRRVPGEHRSAMAHAASVKLKQAQQPQQSQSSNAPRRHLPKQRSEESDGEFLSGEVINGAGALHFGPSVSPFTASMRHRKSTAEEIHLRLARVQLRLQEGNNLPVEEMETLRREFSDLIHELRCRKSIVTDDNREAGDFDEELDMAETVCSGSGTQRSRRPSLPGIVSLTTSAARRRSVGISLTRPLIGGGQRSRSGSRVATTHVIPLAPQSFRREDSEDIHSLTTTVTPTQVFTYLYVSNEYGQSHQAPLLSSSATRPISTSSDIPSSSTSSNMMSATHHPSQALAVHDNYSRDPHEAEQGFVDNASPSQKRRYFREDAV